jgi:hypothetical protein
LSASRSPVALELADNAFDVMASLRTPSPQQRRRQQEQPHHISASSPPRGGAFEAATDHHHHHHRQQQQRDLVRSSNGDITIAHERAIVIGGDPDISIGDIGDDLEMAIGDDSEFVARGDRDIVIGDAPEIDIGGGTLRTLPPPPYERATVDHATTAAMATGPGALDVEASDTESSFADSFADDETPHAAADDNHKSPPPLHIDAVATQRSTTAAHAPVLTSFGQAHGQRNAAAAQVPAAVALSTPPRGSASLVTNSNTTPSFGDYVPNFDAMRGKKPPTVVGVVSSPSGAPRATPGAHYGSLANDESDSSFSGSE